MMIVHRATLAAVEIATRGPAKPSCIK